MVDCVFDGVFCCFGIVLLEEVIVYVYFQDKLLIVYGFIFIFIVIEIVILVMMVGLFLGCGILRLFLMGVMVIWL